MDRELLVVEFHILVSFIRIFSACKFFNPFSLQPLQDKEGKKCLFLIRASQKSFEISASDKKKKQEWIQGEFYEGFIQRGNHSFILCVRQLEAGIVFCSKSAVHSCCCCI